jgi:F1F0 ATPase subunit 2
MTSMSDVLDCLLAFAAGFGLGLAFFFGLWWTVSRLSRGNCAAWLFPLSSFVRTALLLVGFWWVARGDLVRLALCLVSWLIARRFMIRRCGPRAGIAEKGGAACA